MKPSTAAFWLLMTLVIITAIVTILAIINTNEGNNEVLKSFFDIMKYAITLVGGGYLGVQVGEKYPKKEVNEDAK